MIHSQKKGNDFMKNNPILQLLMIGIGIIILFTAVIIGNQTRSQTPTPQPLLSEEESFPEVTRVSLEEALLANKTGSAVFIDVRDRSAYEETHIPDSLSFPLVQLESQLKELDPDAWIITYCTWPAEESSARAARILLDNGFEKVTPILGGLRAWEEAGYPVETSP